MGLCFDQTVDLLGKKNYPYAEVTPMAIKLWKHYLPDVKVYLKLIYTRKDMTSMKKIQEMYAANLENWGVDVIEWADVQDAGANVSCVLQAQVSRLFLYQRPFIKPQDVIVTVDVNLFVMASHILEPIHQFPDMQAWIFQYEETAHIGTGNGETFNQVFCMIPLTSFLTQTGQDIFTMLPSTE